MSFRPLRVYTVLDVAPIVSIIRLSLVLTCNGGCADAENSTYTLVNVCLPIAPEKAAMLQFQLDLKGIACSKGSACQSGSNQQSHVLSAILDEDQLKRPSVRFSFSKFNTKDELDYVVSILKEFVIPNEF